MGGLNIAEKRLPQDGRIRIKLAGKDVDIRVSTVPTAHGERIVMRLLDKSNVLLDLAEIGFEELAAARSWTRLITRSHGIMLVTGPTGSGKTTTLYAALSQDQLARPEHPHRRGPGRVPAQGHRPGAGEPEDRAHLRERAARRSCARIPTSSWSARSATTRPPRSRSRRRSPATSCSRPSTPTTPPARSRASSTWASSRSSSPRRSSACSRSASCACSARTAASRTCPTDGGAARRSGITDDDPGAQAGSPSVIYKAQGCPACQQHRLPGPHRHLRAHARRRRHPPARAEERRLAAPSRRRPSTHGMVTLLEHGAYKVARGDHHRRRGALASPQEDLSRSAMPVFEYKALNAARQGGAGPQGGRLAEDAARGAPPRRRLPHRGARPARRPTAAGAARGDRSRRWLARPRSSRRRHRDHDPAARGARSAPASRWSRRSPRWSTRSSTSGSSASLVRREAAGERGPLARRRARRCTRRSSATLYVNMIRAGETSGALEAVLVRLADFTESQARLRSKIVGTMTYPAAMMRDRRRSSSASCSRW